jgi:tetratricopeptide (TPR) repeat protein
VNKPFAEAETLAAELSSSLAGVAQLYSEHCEHMGLGEGDCPARAWHERLVEESRVCAAMRELRAVEISPNAAGPHRALSEALVRMGNLDLALVHRRHAARLDPGAHDEAHDDAIAIGRLLESQGCLDRAVIHYRALATRWPSDPEVRARLVQACGLDDGEPIPWSSDGSLSAHDSGGNQDTDYLAVLAWTAAAFPPHEYPDSLRRELVTAAARAVEALPDNGSAYLAKGYALLAIGSLAEARQCFATASLLYELGGPASRTAAASGRQVQSALADARRWLLDPTERPQQPGSVAPIDESALGLAHARELRRLGDVYGALRTCEAVVARYFIRSTPLLYERYKQYKIVSHLGLYYAIPGHVREFKIVDGVVCRQSGIEQYARFRVPRRIVDMIRRFIGRRGGTPRPLLMVLRRLRLWLYALPGVKVADSMETLLAEIDRSSAVTTIKPPVREG